MTSKWIISSQVLRAFTGVKVTDAVQRADVGRSLTTNRGIRCAPAWYENTGNKSYLLVGMNRSWFPNFIRWKSYFRFLFIIYF